MVSLSALLMMGAVSLPLLASTSSAVAATPRETPAIATQSAEPKGSNTVASDFFGSSVAVSGTTAVVGAFRHASKAGQAYVFTETTTGWKQVVTLKGSDTVAGDEFGYSVAISGTTAVVGAPDHARSGGAYVFTETTTGWKQVAELTGSDSSQGDGFGYSVAISGTTIVVGALAHAEGGGSVYVFARAASGWTQVAELKGSDTVEGNQFGSSVAVAGTTAIIGDDPYAEGKSRAYVFTKTATHWKQVAELKGFGGDIFGDSVAISGTTAVVGAADQAYVFTNTAVGWKQVAELKGAGGVYELFGSSVAVSGSTVVVGAYGYANMVGQAYVFTKTGATWKGAAELTGSGTLEQFGISVAISGTTAVVGAQGFANGAGLAYVFYGSTSFGCSPRGVVITGSGPPDEPTGLATFGDAPPGGCLGAKPVAVSTSEILGYASFSTLAVSSVLSNGVPVQGNQGLSIQLNTVLQVQSAGTSYYYLIQNFAVISTAETTVNVGSNVYGWGTSTQNYATASCAQLTQTVTYEMDNMSGKDSTISPSTGHCSPYFYVSGAPGPSYQLPLSMILGTEIVGDQVLLFYQLAGSSPVVWDTLTFSLPNESLSLIASPTYSGMGVGSANLLVVGPGGGTDVAFSSLAGELGLYYLAGGQPVPFTDIQSATGAATAIAEGAENEAVGIGADGFLSLSVGTPVELTDDQFNPQFPSGFVTDASGGG
jgi:hypothetical protein